MLPGYRPGSRESKTPVDSRFTTEHLRCSTVEPQFMPVYPGVTQVVYGDVPVTAVVSPFHDGSTTVASIVTLHYKTRGRLDLPILEYAEDARTAI